MSMYTPLNNCLLCIYFVIRDGIDGSMIKHVLCRCCSIYHISHHVNAMVAQLVVCQTQRNKRLFSTLWETRVFLPMHACQERYFVQKNYLKIYKLLQSHLSTVTISMIFCNVYRVCIIGYVKKCCNLFRVVCDTLKNLSWVFWYVN